MLKFYRILLLTLVAVFLASAAGVARYAAVSYTQSRMYRQLAAQTEKLGLLHIVLDESAELPLRIRHIIEQ